MKKHEKGQYDQDFAQPRRIMKHDRIDVQTLLQYRTRDHIAGYNRWTGQHRNFYVTTKKVSSPTGPSRVQPSKSSRKSVAICCNLLAPPVNTSIHANLHVHLQKTIGPHHLLLTSVVIPRSSLARKIRSTSFTRWLM